MEGRSRWEPSGGPLNAVVHCRKARRTTRRRGRKGRLELEQERKRRRCPRFLVVGLVLLLSPVRRFFFMAAVWCVGWCRESEGQTESVLLPQARGQVVHARMRAAGHEKINILPHMANPPLLHPLHVLKAVVTYTQKDTPTKEILSQFVPASSSSSSSSEQLSLIFPRSIFDDLPHHTTHFRFPSHGTNTDKGSHATQRARRRAQRHK